MSKSKFRAAACVTGLLVSTMAMTTPARADTASSEPGLLSPAGFFGAIARATLSYARLVADVRYDSMQVDGARNALTIRDLRIAGLGAYQECKVEVGRFQLSGLSFWGSEHTRMRMDAGDIKIANNCFGANAAMIGIVTVGPQIEIAQLSISSRQSFGSGQAAIDIEATAPGLARIEASADFDYVSISSPELLQRMIVGEPMPPMDEEYTDLPPPPPPPGLRGTLRHAHVSAEDLGAWARLSPLITPDIANPAAIDGLVTTPAGTPTGDFQTELASALKAFIAKPGRLTVEVRPETPTDFDSTQWTSPDDAIALFKPQVTNAIPTPAVALIADPMDQSDPRALGLALAAGQGVPQDRNYAIELLQPLAGDPEVDLALADLLIESDPLQAYGHASAAAAQKAGGAIAVMETIETRLTTSDILSAQLPVDYAVPAEVFASPIALRDAAVAYERGDTAPRSYALAWRLASLAAATGDSPSQSLLDRLAARFEGDADWIKVRDAAAAQAITDWNEHGLGKAAR